MRYPEFLKENGTIGFVAPSFGCATEPYITRFASAQKKWKALGYSLDLGPNATVAKGVGISNKPELCGAELNDYYCKEDNDILISCGGGELMCEVIPYMDFERIKAAKPKWYLGFSDNTNFTFLSTTICDTAAIYGPCAGDFGMEPWHPSLQDAMDLLTGKTDRVHGYELWEKEWDDMDANPIAPYYVTEPVIIKPYDCAGDMPRLMTDEEKVVMEGRLIGGCLDCLVGIRGTEFDHVQEFNEKYQEDGIIWFLESCDLNIMSMRRALWQLKHTGWFQHLKGFLIGRPLHFGEEMFDVDQYEAVLSMLSEYHVPVIMDLDIGHLSPMMPIISGSTAEVTVETGKIEIHYTFQ